jgi:hypothetical protein
VGVLNVVEACVWGVTGVAALGVTWWMFD